jgi:Tfp pilus assembly ATPase PilU
MMNSNTFKTAFKTAIGMRLLRQALLTFAQTGSYSHVEWNVSADKLRLKINLRKEENLPSSILSDRYC